jgi:hypothetical protein
MRRDGVLEAIVLVALVAHAALLWREWCAAPGASWNGPHLAPSFAIARGINFYTDPVTQAPAAGWMYGPVMPLLLVPVAWLRSVVWAATNAATVQTAAVLLPMALLLHRRGVGATGVAFGTLLALGLLSVDPVTYDIWRVVRADGFALGGAMCSLALLLGPSASRLAMHGSALAAATAILSKQIALPIAVIGPLIAAWRWSARRGLAQLGLVAGYLVVLLAVFAWWFEPGRLVYSMWTVPARQPLRDPHVVLDQLRSWGAAQGPAVTALLAGLACGAGRLFATPVERALALTAVLFVPATLPALAKVGGMLNSFFPAYFWAAFCAVVATRGVVHGTSPRWARGIAAVILLSLAPITLAMRPRLAPGRWWPPPEEQSLAEIARELDGRVWIPMDPLPTLAAGGPLLPFDDAIWSLRLAGMPPGRDLLRAQVPAEVDHLLCLPSHARCPRPEFPEFERTGATFRGAPVYRRPSPHTPANAAANAEAGP